MDRRQILAGLMALPFGSGSAQAEADPNWPSRPVQIVAGFPAGQTSDILARMYGDALTKSLKQPFIVQNRPGSGGTLAAGMVAKSSPDGYTIYLGATGPNTISPHLYKNLPYDSIRDLIPAVLIARLPFVMFVRPDLPARNVQELIALSMQGNGLTYATGGSGNANHLLTELFKNQTGARLRHIPYKGSPPAHLDLMAGRVDVMFDAVIGVLPLLKAGKLRPIAVLSKNRFDVLPTVPAMSEQLPGFLHESFAGFFLPAGVPEAIVTKLSDATVAIMKRPEFASKLAEMSTYPWPESTPSLARSFVTSEYEKFGKVVKAAGVTVD